MYIIYIQKVYILKRFILVMEKTTQQNTTLKEKKISIYEFKIVRVQDLTMSDYLTVEFSINDELKQLLKDKLVVSQNTKDYILCGTQQKRYLASEYLLNSLYSNYKYMFSDKNLVDNGILKLNFTSITEFNDFFLNIKSNIKKLIENIRDYAQINLTVRYEV